MGEALLIIGPTGAGKTPLGELIQERGYRGRKVCHVDFGAELRKAAAGQNPAFDPDEAEGIQKILDSCRLLDESTYWIADRILHPYSKKDILALNGIPRTVKQAEYLGQMIDIAQVFVMNASADTIKARIVGNTGGDRTGRVDDDLESIKKKFDIYNKMTLPLIDHYKDKCSVFHVEVKEHTTPREIYNLIC
ncbi:nucleoside monophosphate kinase [Thermoproteota archaeon]